MQQLEFETRKFFMMSSSLAFKPLQRFEDLPPFQSCIKNFGRSILPPVLGEEDKNALLRIREEAVNKEADLVKRRKERLNLSEKVKAVFKKIEETQCSSFGTQSISSNTISFNDYNTFQPIQPPESTDLKTLSTVPSNVHDLPVLPNMTVTESVLDTNNQSELILSPNTSVTDTHEASTHVLTETKPSSTETENEFDSTESATDDLYSKQHGENIDSSDECSLLDETDCASLPTVIFMTQEPFCQDADCESTATSVAQSTDLEKYMNCSIETSNLSDSSTTIGDGKEITELCCASDEKSPRTVICNESDLTPTESAMPEYDEESKNMKQSIPNADENDQSKWIKRADSVDSYLNALRLSAGQLYGKKSMSNENICIHDSSENSALVVSVIRDKNRSCENQFVPDSNSQSEVKNSTLNTELPGESKIDDKMQDDVENTPLFIKRHIRNNSYTLDEPCIALAQAHADCSCSLNSSQCSTPHSSAIQIHEVPQPSICAAFSKERVTLSTLHINLKNRCILELQPNRINVENLDVGNSENSASSGIIGHKNNSIPSVIELNASSCDVGYKNNLTSLADEHKPHIAVQESMVPEQISLKSSSSDSRTFTSASHSGEDSAIQKLENSEEIGDMCSFTSVTSDSIIEEEMLEKMYCELQDTHKRKVEKLLEEQHQQWQKLQLELKQQEKLLCEKIERMCTPSFDSNSYMDPVNNQAMSKIAKDNENKNMKINDKRSSSKLHLDLNLEETKTHEICGIQYDSNDPELNLNESVAANQDIVNVGIIMHSSSNSNQCKETNPDVNLIFKNVNPSNNTLPSDSQIHSRPDLYSSCQEFALQTVDTDPNPNVLCNVSTENSSTQTCEAKEGTRSFATQSLFVNAMGDNILIPENLNTQNFRAKDGTRSFATQSLLGNAMGDSTLIPNQNQVNVTTLNEVATGNSYPDKREKEDDSCADEIVTMMPVTVALSCIQANKSILLNKLSFPRKNWQNIYLNDPELKKKFEKVSAAVKGYLIRRLFKTERVQGLIKMLKDTVILLKKMDDDINLKRKAISEHDVEFHRQLIIQLTTVFHQIYSIFCEISIKERMEIIAESRLLERKNQQLQAHPPKSPPIHVTEITIKPQHLVLNQRPRVSSATMKVLERKKMRSALESRTYTIEDFKTKNTRIRTRSSTSLKPRVTSPASIYKTSVAANCKRKTNAMTSSMARRSMHQK